jgi:uncharacterized membrane protein
MRFHLFLAVVVLGAGVGFVFSAFSTHDFVVHLDRQVHGIHCSFLPGIVATDATGASGCHTTMMSPYSSVLRDRYWGGIPVSLPGMSVFAFLLFWAMTMLVTGRHRDPRAAGYLLLATLVPVGTSVAMGYIAFATLDAACKTCIGIYAASGVVFLGAMALTAAATSAARRAREPVRHEPAFASDEPAFLSGEPAGDEPEPMERDEKPPLAVWKLVAATLLGVAFVFVPIGAYALSVPRFDTYAQGCGTLPDTRDPHRILVSVGKSTGRIDAIQVLDPLCSACRAFEARLEASPSAARLQRKALVFPLDSECNWMIDRSVHPGACAVSEAVLCAGEDAQGVLDWAFAEQERILAAGTEAPEKARQIVTERFPELGECLGSAAVKARLNQSLRWAVRNQLPILAPQLYVGGVKLCDEDTDLGLEYMLPRLITHVEHAPRPSRGTERRAP